MFVFMCITLIYVYKCVWCTATLALGLMPEQGFVNLANHSSTSQYNWCRKKSCWTHLSQPLVHCTGCVLVDFCLLSCILGWILPCPPINQHEPFLQGQLRLLKKAPFPNRFCLLAGRAVPTDTISDLTFASLSHSIAAEASTAWSKKTFAPQPSNDCWSATPHNWTYYTFQRHFGTLNR